MCRAFLFTLLLFSRASGVFLDFGADFIWGTAQDAYQFEGSLQAAGAGPSSTHVWCSWVLSQPDNGGWRLCGDVGAGFCKSIIATVF